ncbi:hypothetical protein [Leuconostoc gelidum]|uniref:hypothetical protein n=1 Tax=Leuconostoc gelidum TaxID=1244 RepID=UPI001C7CB414|nr:hypothetical protein [Leuconostoc gelidum]MBZ6009751.1 hypothetical protein [Leuconostoc gelidum subsp. aenigmaticum]
MKVRRLSLFFGVLIVVIIGIQITQVSSLDDQQKQVNQALVVAKKSQSKIKQIVASPVDQQAEVKNATYLVTDFINTVNTHTVSQYTDALKEKATLKVINTLSQQLAPSVTFGTAQKFNNLTVAINRVFDNHLQYAIVEKSDTQSVVYTLTYDIDERLVTDIQRLPLKGTYDNEK